MGFSMFWGDGNSVFHVHNTGTTDAWDATEEVSLGDTNGKADWDRSTSTKTPSTDKDIKVGVGEQLHAQRMDTHVHTCATPCPSQKREKELSKREKELAKKEEELRRREQAVQEAGGVVKEVKNWPRCYPIIHHDIKGDIPEQFTRAVTAAWVAFWVRGGPCWCWAMVAFVAHSMLCGAQSI